MMEMHMYIAFVVAAMVILVIPGPTIILVISQAVAHGRRSVVPLAAGVVCGDFTAMTLSLCGLGAILSASAAVFNILKWVSFPAQPKRVSSPAPPMTHRPVPFLEAHILSRH